MRRQGSALGIYVVIIALTIMLAEKYINSESDIYLKEVVEKDIID
jgi:hypothetical protein